MGMYLTCLRSRMGRPQFRLDRLAVLLLLLVFTTACTIPAPSSRKKKPGEIAKAAPRLVEPRPIAIGATETFSFKADGVWHPAPYMIHRGQRMRVILSNGGALDTAGAVRYRIGQLEQIIIPDPTDFVVTRPGAMSFFYDPSRGGAYEGEVTVIVQRIG